MSAPSSYGAGLGATSRAVSNSRGFLLSGASAKSLPLLTVGMPHLSVWARQVTPNVAGQGVTVLVEFSVRPLVIGPNNDTADEWLAFPTPITLDPSGVPSLVNLLFPVAKIRLNVPDPGFGWSLDYVLGCSA